MVMETGSIFRPVCRASSPITSCRYSGIVKKTPIRIRFWLNSPIRPERSGGDLQQRQVHQRVRASALSVTLPHRERPQQDHAEADHEDRQREAERGHRGVLLGLTQPQVLDCSTPRTTQAQARGGQHAAHDVELGCRAGPHRVGHLRGHHQDQGHQQHLAGEDDPPRVLRGRPAAQDRPHRDPGPGDPADHRVRHLARGALRSCPRSAPPSPARPAPHRALPGPTSPGSGWPPTAPPPSSPNRSRR